MGMIRFFPPSRIGAGNGLHAEQVLGFFCQVKFPAGRIAGSGDGFLANPVLASRIEDS
jgi:hypothetical protein